MSHLKKVKLTILLASTAFLLTSQFTLVFAEVKVEPYVSIEKPTEIVWSGSRFIVASEKEGVIKLFTVNPRDKSIERFAPTFAGRKEVYIAVSPGRGFPERYVYANRGDTIYEIDPSGDTVRVFSIPSVGANVTSLTFDYGGYFNYNLIATTHEGSVWSIDSLGKAQLITNIGGNLTPSGVFVAPDEYGPFSGNLIVSIKNERKLIAISNRDYKVRDLTELPEAPGRIIYVPSKSNLYLTKRDEDSVVKIDGEFFYPDYIAGLMVLTEDEQSGSGSIFVVHSNKTMVTVLKFASGIKPPFKGSIFVNNQEFADALAGKFEKKGIEINPLLWIIPLAVGVVAVSFAVFWRYRGM